MQLLTSVDVVVRGMTSALASGLVPELIECFVDCSARWSVVKAACVGHVHLLERLGARDAPISERQMDWAMRVAADRGDLVVLQWLHAYRPQYKISTSVMDSAAFAGHLQVVQWLHHNRSEGCTAHAMDSAAACGRVDIVRWLHENRSEGCTTAAMDTAAGGGHLEMLQWLDANRNEGCSSVAVDFAIFNGHTHIVKWLSEHRRVKESRPIRQESKSTCRSQKEQMDTKRRKQQMVLHRDSSPGSFGVSPRNLSAAIVVQKTHLSVKSRRSITYALRECMHTNASAASSASENTSDDRDHAFRYTTMNSDPCDGGAGGLDCSVSDWKSENQEHAAVDHDARAERERERSQMLQCILVFADALMFSDV
ncbi:Myosin light chain kinase-related, partial [Globisporangium splendens]